MRILISNKDYLQRATDLQGVKYLKMEDRIQKKNGEMGG